MNEKQIDTLSRVYANMIQNAESMLASVKQNNSTEENQKMLSGADLAIELARNIMKSMSGMIDLKSDLSKL